MHFLFSTQVCLIFVFRFVCLLKATHFQLTRISTLKQQEICSVETGMQLDLIDTGQCEKNSAFITAANVCFKRALCMFPVLE